MKTAKYILTIVLLAVCGMSTYAENVGNKAERQDNLQAEGVRPIEGYTFHTGDTIIVSKDMKQYLTGQTPSEWIYYVRHVIKQVGGTTYPNGLLLGGIMSWVGQEQVYLIGAVEKTEETQEIEKEGQQEVERRQSELEGKTEEEKQEMFKDILPLMPQKPETKSEETNRTTEPVAEPEQQPKDTVEEERPTMTQLNRFSIGVHGGAASLMHRTEAIGNWRCGFDAALDLQYAHYWHRSDWKSKHGILTGVAIAYSRSGLGSGVDTTYNVTADNHKIEYTISTEDINEKDGQLQIEIPIMYSMVLNNGFFLNVGPRLIVPVYSHYNQSITNPNIVADFTDMGVKVENEAITGLVKDNQMKTKGRWDASKVNVLLGAELGYEWTLQNKNSLGLGVYGNYSVFTLYNHNTENMSLINVGLPSAEGAAPVDVLSATDTYAKGMGYFDAGVKLVYHFNWWK